MPRHHTSIMHPLDIPPTVPALDIAVRSLRSPTGQGRRENQDNYLIIDEHGQARLLWAEQETRLRLTDWPAGHRRVAVLDGMGGHSHGREAAEQTVEGLLNIPASTDLDTLSRALDALHDRLHERFRAADLESGCTLVLLEIPARGPALLCHVGDSRLYAISADSIDCLTVDHVPATHMAMLGLMGSAQWRQLVHAQRSSEISQAFILGSTLGVPQLYAETIEASLFVLNDGNMPLFLHGLGDRRAITLDEDRVYLLASDGLWNLHQPKVFVQRWPALLVQPQQPLDQLLDRLLAELADTIRAQGCQPDDNSTVILLRRAATGDSPPQAGAADSCPVV